MVWFTCFKAHLCVYLTRLSVCRVLQ
jgi:hypothetical protein